jgi:6-phosphogluconate dehydrogenase
MQGSVVRSWLLELTARALADDPKLAAIAGQVADSGEGRWTVQEAVDRAVPLPVITAALYARFDSRADNPFANRLLAALRHQFGGHAVKRID